MKLLSLPSLATLLLGAARIAYAQNCVATALAVIPSCAQNCIINGATAVGCGGTDFSCQCQKTAALFAAVDGCVAAACPSASYQAVIDGASTVCGCASPVVLAGTATVSGISGISSISATAPASNTATATGTVTSMLTSTTGSSGTGLTTSSGASASQGGGGGAAWTGYTSVSPVATASVIGAAAGHAAPSLGSVIGYVVPVVVVAAGLL